MGPRTNCFTSHRWISFCTDLLKEKSTNHKTKTKKRYRSPTNRESADERTRTKTKETRKKHTRKMQQKITRQQHKKQPQNKKWPRTRTKILGKYPDAFSKCFPCICPIYFPIQHINNHNNDNKGAENKKSQHQNPHSKQNHNPFN